MRKFPCGSKAYKRIKSHLRCCICDHDKQECLEFHHVIPANKSFDIATGHKVNTEVLLLELEKCVVLCANCHRSIHAETISLKGEHIKQSKKLVRTAVKAELGEYWANVHLRNRDCAW